MLITDLPQTTLKFFKALVSSMELIKGSIHARNEKDFDAIPSPTQGQMSDKVIYSRRFDKLFLVQGPIDCFLLCQGSQYPSLFF